MGRLSGLDLLLKEPQIRHALAEIDLQLSHCPYRLVRPLDDPFCFNWTGDGSGISSVFPFSLFALKA